MLANPLQRSRRIQVGRVTGQWWISLSKNCAPNPQQPRQNFDEQELNDLANSIREKGILQPIIVRPDPQRVDDYQIVAGERRWRAAQQARLHTVPVLVRELDDLDVVEIAIVENVQRSDLNAIEEATGYQQLMTRFGHTQEKLSAGSGKKQKSCRKPRPAIEFARARSGHGARRSLVRWTCAHARYSAKPAIPCRAHCPRRPQRTAGGISGQIRYRTVRCPIAIQNA